MKKTILSLIALAAVFSGSAQTQIFFEDFESGPGGFTLNTTSEGGVSGTTGDNYWIVNSDYGGGSGTVMTCAPLTGFAFTIPATPAQPAGISNMNGGYMHLISEEAFVNGILSTSLSPAENSICVFSASHFTEMTADMNTTNFTAVTLDFWWLNNNSANATGELYYSIDGGTNWIQKTGTNFYGQATWTNTVLTDPAWDGQATLRFGMKFDNINTTGVADPAIAIDDFEVSGTLGTPCTDSNSSFTVNSCGDYTVPSGDETYTAAGTQTVMDTILNVSGCDSIMTISLNITIVDTMVTDNLDGTATANSSSGTFQWLDCDNAYAVIAGETAALFSPGATGNYAVEITDNGCVDTSACLNIAVGGLGKYLSTLEVYPNPSNGAFTIEFGNYSHEISMTITDLSGQTIFTKNQFIPGVTEQMDLNVAPGVYILSIKELGTAQFRKVRITIE